MIGFTRLLWVYLFRFQESTANTMKKLDGYAKHFLPSNRKLINPSEIPLEYFVQMVHMIGCRVPEYTLRSYLSVLLNLDENYSGLDSVGIERALIGIFSFVRIANTLISNKGKVPFPNSQSGISPTGKPVSAPSMARPRYSDSDLALHSLLDASRKINDVSASMLIDLDKVLDSNYDTRISSEVLMKQGYIDLLESILDSIPTIMPIGKDPQNMLVVLSKYTGHYDERLSATASKAFRRIVENCHDLLVSSIRFAGSFLIHVMDHSESTLVKHIVEYLNLVKMIKSVIQMNSPSFPSGSPNIALPSSSDYDLVLDLESKCIAFLCSNSVSVRKKAIEFAALAREVDECFHGENKYASILRCHKGLDKNRLFETLDCVAKEVIESEIMSKFLKGTLKSDQRNLSKELNFNIGDLALLDSKEGRQIWDISLEKLLDYLPDYCPSIVLPSIMSVQKRFQLLTPFINTEQPSSSTISSGTLKLSTLVGSGRYNSNTTKSVALSSSSSSSQSQPKFSNFLMGLESDETSDQWCKYIWALLKLIRESDTEMNFKPTKTSRTSNMLRDILRVIGPFLSVEKYEVRQGISRAISKCHWSVFHVVFDYLRPVIDSILDDLKSYKLSRTISGKKSKRLDILRIEVIFILGQSCRFLNHQFYQDDAYLQYFCLMVKDTKDYLSYMEGVYSMDWDTCVILRSFLYGLIEGLHESFLSNGISSSFFSNDLRVSLFVDMEEWCGYGVHRVKIREREAKMMSLVLDQARDTKERGFLVNLMEDQRRNLEKQVLRAMVSICKGSLYGHKGKSLDRKVLFQWITAMFSDPNELVHAFAKSALENVLVCNEDIPAFVEETLLVIFSSASTKSIVKGFFVGLKQSYERISLPCRPATLLVISLFKMGDSDLEVRICAFEMLRLISIRNIEGPFPFEALSVCYSPYSSIYQKAVVTVSAFLAFSLPSLAFDVINEVAYRLDQIRALDLTSVLTSLPAWIATISLSFEPDGQGLSQRSAAVLHNLLFISIKIDHHYEELVANLWQTLSLPESNVKPIIVFFTRMVMEKRNPDVLVSCGRIFSFMSRNERNVKYLSELLVSHLIPKAMILPARSSSKYMDKVDRGADFVADLDGIFPDMPRNPAFNSGQICSLFMAHVFVDKMELAIPYLPLLLHTIVIHLDHYNEFIFEGLHRFLFILIKGLAPKLEQKESLKSVETILLESMGKRLWVYEDVNLKTQDLLSIKHISKLVKLIISLFQPLNPNIAEEWGLIALKWSTTCPVRHLAGRSLQIFREISPEFNLHMLADLLARLSNTIASNVEDIQSFALDLLITMKSMVSMITTANLRVFPNFFWSLMICLQSPLMHEYLESVHILKKASSYFMSSYAG
jgi:hypothetical protein